MKRLFIWVAVVLLPWSCSRHVKPALQVETDEAYNVLFTRTDGWSGGDVACTVPLSDSVTLWLFGDSWIGPVVDNRHNDARMINNAVAVQLGKNANPDKLTFFYGQVDGKPASLFIPPDGRGFFWLTGGGILMRKGLVLMVSQIVKIEGDPSVFGFEGIGNYIFSIANPLDDPDHWQVEMKKMPFFEKSRDGSEISFGTPQFYKDGFIYVYGTLLRQPEMNRFMLLARVPEDHLMDFGQWEFYSGVTWQNDFKKASRLCDRFGAEYSVSWQPSLKKYITIYSELGMSEKIMMRTSLKPEGPWSEQEIVYTAPEADWDKDNFCYAARAHPELSGTGDLLISYICNSTDFWKMAADARIYRPKFVRIRFER